jgi:hypothetical protein
MTMRALVLGLSLTVLPVVAGCKSHTCCERPPVPPQPCCGPAPCGTAVVNPPVAVGVQQPPPYPVRYRY